MRKRFFAIRKRLHPKTEEKYPLSEEVIAFLVESRPKMMADFFKCLVENLGNEAKSEERDCI